MKIENERQKIQLKTAILGIISNLSLVGIKVFAYLITHSVSILADAINNLTDSLSSFVTLIGAKISNMPADSEHPYGHGRVEYVAGFIVSALVLFAGFEFVKISVDKIIHSASVEYTPVTVGLMIFSILVKFIMSVYYKKIGTKINSYPIMAQSKDSLSDVFVTGVVVISIVAHKFTNLSIDGWAGLVVSGFILYQGYDLIKDTISEIIGKTNPQEIKEIEQYVLKCDEVQSVHDIVVVDFGPEKVYAWMDVELDAKMSFVDAHAVIDKIEKDLYDKFKYQASIHLDPVGIYSKNESEVVEEIVELINADDRIFSFHDLKVTEDEVSIDVVVDGEKVKTEYEIQQINNEIGRVLEKIVKSDKVRLLINIDRVFN